MAPNSITEFIFRNSSTAYEEAMAKRRDGFRVALGPHDGDSGRWHVRILGMIEQTAKVV